MATERIARFATSSKPHGPDGHLEEELNPVMSTGSQVPETGPSMDPSQQAFLDGLNAYLQQLIKMDLPPAYMHDIETVLAGQVSQVTGKQVSADQVSQVISGKESPGKVDATQGTLTTQVPGSGKAPSGMPPDLWDSCVTAGKKTGVDPYILAAQMEKESRFGQALGGSSSGGDGLMQVEPSTRAAYASKFQEKIGHAYNHGSKDDQVAMAAVILGDKGGSATSMLQKYNGGDNWTPGCCDSYGREIKAGEYASTVCARAEAMKSSAA